MSDRKEEMLRAAEAEAEKAKKETEAEKKTKAEAEAKKKAEAEKAEKAKKEAEAEKAKKETEADPIRQLLERVIDLQTKQAERMDGIEQKLEAYQPGAEPEVHFTMDDLGLLGEDDADEVAGLMEDIMASKTIISEKLAEAKRVQRDFEKTFKSLFG